MKRWHTLSLLAAALLLCLAASACAGSDAGQNDTDLTDAELDEAVTALLRQDQGSYYGGEFFTTAHVLLSAQQEDDVYTVYTVASVNSYGFQNEQFLPVSGTGAIPYRFTFTKGADGQLQCSEYWMPSDGNLYVSSIEEAFPKDLQSKAIHADRYFDQLAEQQEAQAQEYLDRIGRQADMIQASDFDAPLFTDQGMSVTVSNALCGLEELSPYPLYIGTQEAIEDGIRWVYETAWEHDSSGNGTVTYTKYCYDDGEIADQMSFLVQGDTYEKIGS